MASIQGVYVALFGRPADPTGLAYFNSITNGGQNLAGIANLAGTAEYQSRFTGLNNVQIINSIYQSLFGRDADLAGLNFFADALSKGTLNINNIAIAILDGAQGNDKTIVTNKVNAADAYTKALDTGAEVVAYSGNAAAAQGVAFLKTVTTTAPTSAQVDAAVATMVTASTNGGTGSAGVTLTLTDKADLFAPTTTVDATKTTAGNDTIRGLTKADLTSADNIDGGAGTDTLQFVVDTAGATLIKPVLKNIELVSFGTDGANNALTGDLTIDLGDSSGVQTLTANVGAIADGKIVTLSGVENAAKVVLAGLTNTTAKVATAAVNFKTVSGSNDSATISLNGVTKTGNTGDTSVIVKVAGIENLSIETTKDSKISLDAADAKALKLSGSGALELFADANAKVGNVTSIDASAATGNFTATVSKVTVTGSKGIDTLTFTDGTVETAVYNSTNVSTISKLDEIKTFKTAEDKIDVKAFSLTTLKTDAFLVKTAAGGDIADYFKDSGTAYAVVKAGDTYFVDVNKDGNFSAGTDLAVKITGSDVKITDFAFA